MTDSKASKSKSKLLHSLNDAPDEVIASAVYSGKIPAYRLEEELKAGNLTKGEFDTIYQQPPGTTIAAARPRPRPRLD